MNRLPRLDERELLALWERALPLPPPLRARELAWCEDGPAATLGEMNRRLLELQLRLTGPRLALLAPCPHCGETASFEIELPRLLQGLPEFVDPAEQVLSVDGWTLRFRLPAPADLPEAALDEQGFVRQLLERCVVDLQSPQGAGVVDGAWPAPLLAAWSEHLEAADPGAEIGFELACPACGRAWHAPFDPAAALWSWLQTLAERSLLDIDALARRYGWSEDQVLALTPTRRNAYLQLAQVD
ncbi:MAG: hypothetical protein KGI35_17055 [Burkholderiales bacterium]|nr:hypothetical protein [Burkholderiales bacterium]